LSGETLTSAVNKNKLIAAKLRFMADALLYQECSRSNFLRLEEYLRESARLHPEAAENYLLMAKAYHLYKDFNKVRQSAIIDHKILNTLEKALEYDPNNSEAKILYALVFIAHENWQLAADYLKDVLSFKTDSFVLEQLGNCCFNLGRVREAFDYYSLALQLQPRHHVLHTHRGFCCLKAGDLDEAYQESLRATILAPKFKPALVLRKEALKYLSRRQKTSASAIEKELASQLADSLKDEVFSKPFETDPLTGLANEESLQLWSYQSSLKNVHAVAANLSTLREASLLLNATATNDMLKAMVDYMKELYPEAVFAARPRADKMVFFLTTEPAMDKLTALGESTCLRALGLNFGFGKGVIHEALASCLKSCFGGADS